MRKWTKISNEDFNEFLTSIPKTKIDWFAINHDVGWIIVKDSRNVLAWESVGRVRNQKTSLSDSSVTYNDTFNILPEERKKRRRKKRKVSIGRKRKEKSSNRGERERENGSENERMRERVRLRVSVLINSHFKKLTNKSKRERSLS